MSGCGKRIRKGELVSGYCGEIELSIPAGIESTFLCKGCGGNWELDNSRPAAIHEPPPTKEKKGRVVVTEVIADLEARSEVGKIKYGQKLRSGNGRNALIDAYQEALDLCMYLKQLLIEEE